MSDADTSAGCGTSAFQVLAVLAKDFIDLERLRRDASVVGPTDIPEPCRGLLVHREHMTVTLEAHFGEHVELRVLREQQEGDAYRRMILLTVPGRTGPIEFGLVRMNLAEIPKAARDEILKHRAPLGDVLVRHDVMRRVEPKWYFHFPASSGVVSFLENGPTVAAYGRIAVIHCNGRQAIELLEVVPYSVPTISGNGAAA